jgi:hypothetical protein
MISSGWHRSIEGRSGTAQAGLQLVAAAVKAQHRHAGLLDRCVMPGLAGSTVGIKHVVPRKSDMEKVERLVAVGSVEHDAPAVDQIDHRHQYTVGENCMRSGQNEISRWRTVPECPGLHANGSRRTGPAAVRTGSVQGKARDVPDRRQAAESGLDQIAVVRVSTGR